MQVHIDEFTGIAYDRLRVATEPKVDTVLELDDVLVHDQPFALVLANLGQESLYSQFGALGCSHLGLGDLQAILLKRDDVIQVLEPFVERHKPVISVGNLRDQTGYEESPPFSGAEVAQPRRVPGIPQLPVDVELPEEVEAGPVASKRIGKEPTRGDTGRPLGRRLPACSG